MFQKKKKSKKKSVHLHYTTLYIKVIKSIWEIWHQTWVLFLLLVYWLWILYFTMYYTLKTLWYNILHFTVECCTFNYKYYFTKKSKRWVYSLKTIPNRPERQCIVYISVNCTLYTLHLNVNCTVLYLKKKVHYNCLS